MSQTLRQAFGVGAVCACLTVAIGCPSRGRIELEGGDLEALEKESARAVRDRPSDARALARHGVVLLARKQVSPALERIERAARMAPADGEIQRWRARALCAAGRPREAHVVLEQLIAGDPAALTAEYVLVLDAYASASADAKTAPLLDPLVQGAARVPEAARARAPAAIATLADAEAQLRLRSGNAHEAVAAFERAIAATGPTAERHFGLGEAHLAMGALDRAKASFAQWVTFGSGTRRSRLEAVARAYSNAFRFKEEREAYADALGEAPDALDLRLALATAHLKDKDLAGARPVLAAVLAAAQRPGIAAEVGRLYLQFRHLDDALAAWKRALALAPGDLATWKIVARLLRDAGRTSEIEAFLGGASEGKPLAWAELWADLADWPRTLAAAKRATASTASADGGARPWVLLGLAHGRLGQLKERDAAFERAIARAATPADGLREVALALETLQDAPRALATWRRLLTTSPGSEEAAFAVARTLEAQKDEPAATAVLAAWAEAQPAGAPRARAWLRVAQRMMDVRSPKRAADALERVIGGADRESRRTALLLSAELHLRAIGAPARAEQLYLAWIESSGAEPAERNAARQRVLALIAKVEALLPLRVRLTEDQAQERPDDSALLLELGELYLSIRPPRLVEARRTFGRVLAMAPDRARAALDLGRRLQALNQSGEAVQVFREVPPEAITEPSIHRELAELFLRYSDLRRAEPHLRSYLDVGRDEIAGSSSARAAVLALGRQLLGRQSGALAVLCYEAVAPHEANRATILQSLGEARLVTGDVAGASRDFEEFLEATGRSDGNIEWVGQAFAQGGYAREARRAFEQLFTEKNRFRLAHIFSRLLDVTLKDGATGEAIALCERYVGWSPNPLAANQEVSVALQAAGLFREAVPFLIKATELAPHQPDVRLLLGRLLMLIGEVERAEEVLRRHVAADRASPAAWAQAAEVLIARGEDARVLAFLGEAEKAGVGSGGLWVTRARLRLRRGELELAQADLLRAADDAGAVTEALSVARGAYVLRGPWLERYVELLSRAAAAHPTRVELLLELARTQGNLGRLIEARHTVERYVDGNAAGLSKGAQLLRRLGDIEGAQRLYERAIDDPTLDNRDQVMREALTFIGASTDRATYAALAQRVIASVDDPTPRLESIGQDASLLGYPRLAVVHLERAIRELPSGAAAVALVRAHLQLGELAQARAVLRLPASAMPAPLSANDAGGVPPAFTSAVALASVFESFGHFSDAADLLEAAAAPHPEVGRLSVEIARLRWILDDDLGALRALGRLAAHPLAANVPGPALERLHALIVARKREREALEQLARTAPADRSPDLALEIARLALRIGDRKTARDEFERILASLPSPKGLAVAGALFREADLRDEAMEFFRAVLEPGRGGGSVPPAAAQLLSLAASAEEADALASEVEVRVSRLVSDARQRHEHLTAIFAVSGQFARAIRHAEEWRRLWRGRPIGPELIREGQPNPWRHLIELHLLRGDAPAALAAIEDYIARADDPGRAERAALRLAMALHEHGIAETLIDRVSKRDQSNRRVHLLRGILDLAESAPTPSGFARYRQGEDSAERRALAVATALRNAGRAVEAGSLLAGLAPGSPELQLARLSIAVELEQIDVLRQLLASMDAHTRRLGLDALAQGYLAAPHAAPSVLLAVLPSDDARPGARLARLAATAEVGPEGGVEAAADALIAGVDGVGLPWGGGGASSPSAAVFTTLGLKALKGGRLGLASRMFERALAAGGPVPRPVIVGAILEVAEPLCVRPTPLPEALALRPLCAQGLVWLEPLRGHSRSLAWFHNAEAVLRLCVGQEDLALAGYREALAENPADPTLHNNFAYLLSEVARDLETAESLVERALRLDPRQGFVYQDTAAWVLYRRGKHAEALVRIDQALRFWPQTPRADASESFYHRGEILWSLGRKDDAQKAWQRAIVEGRLSNGGKRAAARLSETR